MANYPTPEELIEDATSGQDCVVNIGQVTEPAKRALDKEVKAGRLVKWRGYWYPLAGADYGMGPLKTCWGTPEYRDAVTFAPAKVAA